MEKRKYEFKEDWILLRFRAGACVECGGKVIELASGEEKEGISFIYNTASFEKGLEIRTGIVNRSGRDIFVRSIEAVRIEEKEDVSFPCPGRSCRS